MTDFDQDTAPRRTTYSFRISRDFPKIWADRTDIVIVASIVIAVILFGTSYFLETRAPSALGRGVGLRASSFTTVFWIFGSVLCLAATAMWLTMKFQSIRIEEAPSLSRTHPMIRYAIYVLLLCGPFAFLYAELSQRIEILYAESSFSYFNFDMDFFDSQDPWLSWITFSVLMALLVFTLLTYRLGASRAVGAFIVTLLWWGTLAGVGALTLTSLNEDTATTFGYLYGGLLLALIVLGVLVGGARLWSHICLVAPALFSATMGPWILVAQLMSNFSLITFPDVYTSVIALFVIVLTNGFLLALLEKMTRR